MQKLITRCSKCGSEENLSQPLFAGVCIDCIRRGEEAKQPPPKPKPTHKTVDEPRLRRYQKAERWTGMQFIGWSGMLFFLALPAGFFAAVGIQSSDAQGLGYLFSLASTACLVWSFILLIVGIIRWGVYK